MTEIQLKKAMEISNKINLLKKELIYVEKLLTYPEHGSIYIEYNGSQHRVLSEKLKVESAYFLKKYISDEINRLKFELSEM